MNRIFSIFITILICSQSYGQKPRARDLGIPLDGKTGKLNAITDVKGIEVGHTTLISGEGKLVVGDGPIRTGVTAVLPRGKKYDPVFAGWYSLNGNGEMTGTTWIEESGFLEGPIMITNTHSVGIVRDAVVEWQFKNKHFDPLPNEPDIFWALPVVAETYDGDLNDINGFHVKKEHAFSALNNAKSGVVAEGNVGGGTGMICHLFKGGIGTSSREVIIDSTTYTLGVIVQANYGSRKSLTIAGVPVGKEIADQMPLWDPIRSEEDRGSIIVIIATDAPLLPHQLKRLARRAPIGISRLGGYGSNGSGDIFVAFSTANKEAADREKTQQVEMIPNDKMSILFEATAQATEESILNALVAAETMVGKNNTTVYEMPEEKVIEILKKYGRIKK
ncbi:P1 family peptidase [Lacinutrix himadriensis]|uniref:DmpA family aminopeptidase n=1 Tax=Lacinutrix himadriensis TaxID=641549 RepID=UPI0006E2B249|nr:P1 family peptidase [Lacinutrix himadriensis]